MVPKRLRIVQTKTKHEQEKMSETAVVLIPARMESTRLPNKPLMKICDIPMVVHVAKRSQMASNVDQVIVCTDSSEVVFECERYGIEVCLTKSSHVNGTERIAEAAEILDVSSNRIIIDVQGDEPFVKPEYIEEVLSFMSMNDFGCVVPHQLMDERGNLNRVKMVTAGNRVLYFSRLDIPCNFADITKPMKKHLSIIGFRKNVLEMFADSPMTLLETSERIELMRLLELGSPIGTFLQSGQSLSVDTPEDYQLACRMMERDETFAKMMHQGRY